MILIPIFRCRTMSTGPRSSLAKWQVRHGEAAADIPLFVAGSCVDEHSYRAAR